VEKLWSFVFAMGFIYFLRASKQIMSLDRASESNVMAVQICMGIPFQLLIAMIYYGPQSDILVKTFSSRNSPVFSMLNFESRDRLLALLGDPMEKLWSSFQLLIAMIYYGPQSDIRVKSFARRNSPESSMLNFERRDRFLSLFGDPEQKLWPFVFAMGFIFILRASQYIMSFHRES